MQFQERYDFLKTAIARYDGYYNRCYDGGYCRYDTGQWYGHCDEPYFAKCAAGD